MNKTTKQRLLQGCLAAAVVVSSTFIPLVANAAMPSSSPSEARLGGFDQYETAALMAQKGWPSTSTSVVLSAGMKHNLVDALSAGPLAAKLKAPILLTDGGASLNPFAKAELERLKPEKVYLTSGTAVLKPTVLKEIKDLGINEVVQLGGYDQYETSINIAQELTKQGVNSSRFILTGGWASPADALSVASIAAAQGIPILTTTQGELPPSVKTYLDSIKSSVTEAYVVGGSAVVSEAVQAQLPVNKVSRYSGQTKYDTNVQVLKGFAKEYKNDKVYIANGESLVDALAGVPLAAASQSPIVLVDQSINNATKDFIKLTMSTENLVALGGQAAVLSAGMNALTTAVSYATDSATVGSTDANRPLELTDNVYITGNNITLTNAKAAYSVYIKGDNIKLNNVTAKGTVFVDPGDKGTATLDSVTAGSIVVLSGASDSIHLNNTSSGLLTVDSKSSTVRVVSTGTTTIGNTVVRSYATLDTKSGSMGEIIISSALGQSSVVELRGTFSQPVVVVGQANIRAAEGASISLRISPRNTDQPVTLEGTFKTIELKNETQLNLKASAIITDLIASVNAHLQVDQGAKVTHFDNKGNTVTITGSGANSVPASSTISPVNPPAIPPVTSPTIPPVTPSLPPTVPTTVSVTDLQVLTDLAVPLDKVNNGGHINLSQLEPTVKISGFALTADRSCTLRISVRGNTNDIALLANQPTQVTVGDLFLGVQIPGGVSLADLRLFYTTKTLQGQLLVEGQTVGTLSVTITF